ncbi:MAG TPA: tRNA (adenosine(37)-N6)-threonylcarbamoyltransferase complex dimerization subunit type 1 TsaB [Terriglobales bacterium]
MLILAADTSGKNGSIALARFDDIGRTEKAFNRTGREEEPQSSQSRASEILDLVPLEGGTFSAQLVPQISALLRKHNFKKEQIDAFAVASGPGSFTGLRVGLAAIKALAEVLHKPIAAVSRLEVIARLSKGSGEVMAALDAGRNEVYSGVYRIEDGRSELLGEDLLSLPEFLAGAGGRGVVTPDAKIAESARRAGVEAVLIALPQADAVARLGYQKIRAGRTISPEALDATYIRRSDAEIVKSGSSR